VDGLIRVAAIGCGNVGQKAVEAIGAAPDMVLAGIVETAKNIPRIREIYPKAEVADHVSKLQAADVAILSVDSHVTRNIAEECLRLGIHTVDPYDTYSEPFIAYKANLDKIARENGRVAVICSGWDPGFDAAIRAAMEAMIPKGLTYTNFGPGQSMSHSAAARTVPGVVDAYALTLPKGAGCHKRMLYVQVADGYDFEEIAERLQKEPHFSRDETQVLQAESIQAIADAGHRVSIERKGVAGICHNHVASYTMSLVNTATTSQSMVTSARAAMKQKPGCYTVLEIPPIDFIYGDRDKNLARLIYPDAAH